MYKSKIAREKEREKEMMEKQKWKRQSGADDQEPEFSRQARKGETMNTDDNYGGRRVTAAADPASPAD